MNRRRLLGLGATALVVVIALAVIWVSRRGQGRGLQQLVLVSGSEVDASHLPGPQSESAIAIDPHHPQILLAGSNDVRTESMAVYSSFEGGRDWSASHLPAPAGISLCGMSDPSPAIDGQGRQYYLFIGLRCLRKHRHSVALYLARRPDADSRWQTSPLPITRSRRLTLGDDRPMLLIDNGARSPHRGRLYAGWTRFSINPAALFSPERSELVRAAAFVSESDDGGREWSKPFRLSPGGAPLEVRLAAGASGTIYAVWRDAKTDSIYVSRSGDGSSFSAGRFVAGAVVPNGRSCHRFRARIPAQPRRCVSPNPVISVDTSSGPRRERVYVTYGSTSLNQSQDVYVAAFDARLHPLLGVGHVKQVNPPEGFRGADQFLPTSAVDPTTGRLWVCYYQSGTGRRARVRGRFACTASDDGARSWLRPRFVASVASDETGRFAERLDGYGDYEGVAAIRGVAHPIWTDGRHLRGRGEEIYTASLVERHR
jgi:hypothetical protein